MEEEREEAERRRRAAMIKRLLDKCGIRNACTRQVLTWGIEEILENG
jgi:hypothetical protein